MIVLDASVWVSYSLRADSNHAVTQRWLSRYLDAGGEIIAPILIALEVAGAVARVTKRPELGAEASQRLYDLPNVQLVGLDVELAESARALASRLMLRGSDAAYVATAEKFDSQLVTWDDDQRQRAMRLVDARTPAELL